MSLSSFSTWILISSDHRFRQSPFSSSPPLSLPSRSKPSSLHQFPQISRPIKITAMETTTAETITVGVPNSTMKLLFVEMGVGYDQHGYVFAIFQFYHPSNFVLVDTHVDTWSSENRQDVTSAAMRACKNAISSNSIPAFRRGTTEFSSFFIDTCSETIYTLFLCWV